jgi:hypothetical protein
VTHISSAIPNSKGTSTQWYHSKDCIAAPRDNFGTNPRSKLLSSLLSFNWSTASCCTDSQNSILMRNRPIQYRDSDDHLRSLRRIVIDCKQVPNSPPQTTWRVPGILVTAFAPRNFDCTSQHQDRYPCDTASNNPFFEKCKGRIGPY